MLATFLDAWVAAIKRPKRVPEDVAARRSTGRKRDHCWDSETGRAVRCWEGWRGACAAR